MRALFLLLPVAVLVLTAAPVLAQPGDHDVVMDLRGQTTVYHLERAVQPGPWVRVATVHLGATQIGAALLSVDSGYPFPDSALAVVAPSGRRVVFRRGATAVSGDAVFGLEGLYRIEVRTDEVVEIRLEVAAFETGETRRFEGTVGVGAPFRPAGGGRPPAYVRAYRVVLADGAPLVAEVAAADHGLDLEIAAATAPLAFPLLDRPVPSGAPFGRLVSTTRRLRGRGVAGEALVWVTSPVPDDAPFALYVGGAALVEPVPDVVVEGWIAAREAALAAADRCSALTLDLAAGTLNGLAPTASQAEIKAALPCFTGETEEGSSYNEGGGVFFIDHDVYAYTYQDRWEAREAFRGAVVPENPLGSSPERVRAGLLGGRPLAADGLYTMPYGCLALVTNGAGRVETVRIDTRSCAALRSLPVEW